MILLTKRRLVLAAALALVSGALPAAAWAQEKTESVEPAPKVTMTATDCRRLVRHHGQQEADYKPGVDVYGRKVAPADVEGTPRINIPEEITFDLTASLTKYFAKPGELHPILTSDGVLGKIKYNTLTGKLYFDGQPLNEEATDEVVTLCGKVLGQGQ